MLTETIIRPSKRLGQVEEYYFSRKLREIAELRKAGKDIINLGIGSPDLAPAPAIIEELQIAAGQLDNHAYQSYKGLPELRQAFANWYKQFFKVDLDPDREILPLMGSKEGIMHISMSYLDPGDAVLLPNPGYPTYASAARLTGASLKYYQLEEENAWYPDLDQLAAEDLSKVKLMWINYPHMPTGTAADLGFLRDLLVFAKAHEILLVNDNPYAFILNEQPNSLLSLPGAMDCALELNSLSKAHNMAGWRVGMLAGAQPYIETVLRFKSNMDSGMFKAVQLAAAKALLLPQSWYDFLNVEYRKRQQIALKIMDHLGCHYRPKQVGLFVWAKVPSHYSDGYALSDEHLYQNDVFLTPGGIFGSQGEQYIRISLCSKEEVLLAALDRMQN